MTVDDRIGEADRRYQEAEARRATKATPAKPWDNQRRIDRLGWALQDLTERVQRDRGHLIAVVHANTPSEYLVDQMLARIDEIWWVLTHAGILEPSAPHELLVDASDIYGRVEGCAHCAASLAEEPYVQEQPPEPFRWDAAEA